MADEYTLYGVMHFVDKWLEGEELRQDEVNRAATMREKTLKIVESLESELSKYRWIPGEEKLPDKNQCVLVLKDGKVHLSRRYWRSGAWESLTQEDIQKYGRWWVEGPTHWMPLPKVLKEE